MEVFHYVLAELTSQLRLHPLVAIVFVSLSSLAFLNAIIKDLLRTFCSRPAHFIPYRWSTAIRSPSADVPLVILEKSAPISQALAQGSKLYPDGPYKIIHSSHQIVIVPHNWNDIVRNSTIKTLGFQEGFFDLALGDYTGMASMDINLVSLLRQDLVRLLDRVQPTLTIEASEAIDFEIGTCDGWTPITLLPKVNQVINKMSQYVFVGEPLCRDERWLQTTAGIIGGTFGTLPTLWQYSRFARPWVAWRLPALRNARKQMARARELIDSAIQQRSNSPRNRDTKLPTNLMQIVLEDPQDNRRSSPDHHVKIQMDVGRAALFTTGTTCFHVLYHLAKYPEYVKPIRQELAQVIEGSMDRVNAAKLVKLDSFIRECQRWCDLVQLGEMRKVLQPLQLPGGTVLPVGTYLAIDAHNSTFDKSGLENPYKFDGFRFERMRAENGNENKHQAAIPSPNNFAFGSGSQSCPGRFYAVYVIKLVVSQILTKYDFKLKNGSAQAPLMRPVGLLSATDPSIAFVFKRRV